MARHRPTARRLFAGEPKIRRQQPRDRDAEGRVQEITIKVKAAQPNRWCAPCKRSNQKRHTKTNPFLIRYLQNNTSERSAAGGKTSRPTTRRRNGRMQAQLAPVGAVTAVTGRRERSGRAPNAVA